MRPIAALIVAIVTALAVVASPRQAAAEWSADAFLGLGWTANTDLDFKNDRTSRTTTLKDVEVDKGLVLGARGGYWLAGTQVLGELGRYLGAGLEVAYSRHEIPSQRPSTDSGRVRLNSLGIDLVTMTPVAMARYPFLVSSEYPNGRLQPYAILGPTIFVAGAEDGGTFGPHGQTRWDSGFGVRFGPGVGWYVTPEVMVFTEYRFVHAAPTFDFTAGSADVSLNASQFLFGLSYRF